MTAAPQKNNDPSSIHLTKWIDEGRVNSFLSDIFSAWERGRQPFAGGAKTREEEWQKIIRRTGEFSVHIAAAVLEEACGPMIAAATNGVSEQAFANGLAKGRAMGGRNPAGKPPLPAVEIVKTIGEELRKMFESGIEQGRSREDAIIEATKLAKPSGEIVKVQRNGAGEIVGAVKQLVYDGSAVA